MTDYYVKRKERMLEMRMEGKTLREIAAVFSISYQRVRQITGNIGNAKSNMLRNILEDNDYYKDLSTKELAELLGVSIPWIIENRKCRHAISGGAAEDGKEAEDWFINRLNSMGYKAEGQLINSSFDVLVNDIVRLEIKHARSSSIPPSQENKLINPRYHFNHLHRSKNADFYILIIWESKNVFIVPKNILPKGKDNIQMCYPTERPDIGKFQQYKDRYDLIDELIARRTLTDLGKKALEDAKQEPVTK